MGSQTGRLAGWLHCRQQTERDGQTIRANEPQSHVTCSLKLASGRKGDGAQGSGENNGKRVILGDKTPHGTRLLGGFGVVLPWFDRDGQLAASQQTNTDTLCALLASMMCLYIRCGGWIQRALGVAMVAKFKTRCKLFKQT